MRAASLRSEEVILKKSARGYLLLWSSWNRCNTRVYQVSPPCVLQLASLRSEKVVLKKIAWCFFKQNAVVMETCNRRGNDIMGILTKFHLYVCYIPLESLRSEEVNFKKSAWGYLLLFTNIFSCWWSKFRSQSSYRLWVILTHLISL